MNSHDRIRHSVLIDLLRRARSQLPSGPIDKAMMETAKKDSSMAANAMLLAVDIDAVFEALWRQDLLPGADRPEANHTVDSSNTDEDSVIL